jgi:hypothetical protein
MKHIFTAGLLSISFIYLNAQETDQSSHYVLPDFQKGVVLLKNGIKNETVLNYNSLSNEIVFIDNGQTLAIGDQILNQIDTVFIGKRRFIRTNNRFTEILIDSHRSKLLVEYKSKLIPPGKPAAYGGTSQTSSASSLSSLQSDGRIYNLKLPDDYKVSHSVEYWIDKGDGLKNISSLNQLRKLYNDQKDIIKNYIRKNDFDFNNTQHVVLLINLLETD